MRSHGLSCSVDPLAPASVLARASGRLATLRDRRVEHGLGGQHRLFVEGLVVRNSCHPFVRLTESLVLLRLARI